MRRTRILTLSDKSGCVHGRGVNLDIGTAGRDDTMEGGGEEGKTRASTMVAGIYT